MTSFRPVFAALLVSLHGIRKMSSPCSGLAKFTGIIVCLFISAIHPSSAGTNQWTQIGPQAASLNALVIDPSNPSTFYSASGHSIFKSIDGGSSWARLSEVPKSTADYCWVYDLVIHPLDFALYAGTCKGVFKSTDGGFSWVAANSGISTSRVLKIVPDPANASVLYISSGSGAYKTTNGGADWILLKNESYPVFAIDPASPSTLFIVLNDPYAPGIYKSTDGGNAWSYSGAGTDNIMIKDIKVSGNVLYAADFLGVYKSVNGGSSWSLASNGMPGQTSVDQIAIDAENPETVYATVWGIGGSIIIYRSTDGGANWVVASSFDRSQAYATVLTVSPQDVSTIFATTRMGLAKSTDGASTWSFSRGNSGLPLAPTKVIGIDSANPYFICQW